MANKTIAVHLPQDSGNTSLTIRLRAGGTIINTPDTLTETSSTGYFTATVDDVVSAGWHSVDILSGATVRYAGGWVYLPGDTEGTYVVDSPESIGGGGGGLDAAGVRAAVGLASANLDTQLGDIPTVAEFDARSLPSADYFVVGDYTAPTNLSAAQVRSELATELARIDVAISTRLASASYTAPANSDITAIKAKTDNLPATPASSTDVQLVAVPVISPTIERVNGDTDAIRFTWPVDSATITGEVSKNGGSYAAVAGAITQRTTEAGVYWYQLAYNAADRTLGSVRYKFTDGTRTRFVNLLVNPATASVDLQPVLDKLPESGRATTAPQVRTELTTELGRIDATISSRSTFAGGAVASVTAPVTVGTNNDKTGYALATAPPTASVIADAVLTESILDHRNVAHSLAKFVWQIRQANLTVDGTVSNAITPTTLTFSSNISATTSAYGHAVLLFITGPLTGENSPIVSYNNTNGVFVLEEPLTAAPSDGDEFVVIAGSHVHSVAAIQSGLALEATLTDIKGAGFATGTDSLEAISDAIAGTSGSLTVEQAAQLTAIKAKTDLITSQTANQTRTPVNTFAITRGDSFTGTQTVTTNYTGYTATFTIRHRITDAVLCTASATVTSSTVLTVTLTTTNTAFALLVDPTEFGPHPYDIRLVNGAIEKTERGIAIISRDMTRS